MRPTRTLADVIGAAAFSALLFAVPVLLVPLLAPAAGAAPLPPVARELALFFQVLSPLTGFFAATPLILLAARSGAVPGALGAALAVAVLLPLVPPPVAAIYAIEHALPALWLGRRIARGRPVAAGSAVAALVATLLLAASTFLLLGAPGRDPLAPLEAQLREGLASMQGGDGAPAGGAPGALAPEFESALALLRRVLPAVTFIGIFLELAVNALFALRVLNARAPLFPAPDLARFALPERLIWVLIAALALCWAPAPALATVALNAVLPLLVAYLLQGLSIVLHFVARANLSRLGRTLLAVAFGLFPWLLAGPLLLGLLDFRFAFRSRPAAPAPGA
jgi:hypothetical protein